MNPKTFDVILVGGGIMGCATATYLLKKDRSLNVAIIEKDQTYSKSSTILSDGNTRVQFNIKENIQMSLFGLEVLARFAEEMAVGDEKPDVAFRQQGDLFLCDQAGEAAAKQGLALQQQLNCDVVWLPANEIEQRYPLFDMTACAGGTFGRLDGTMDPHAVLMGYKNKAVDLGAHFLQAEVTGVLTEGSHVTGVHLASGDILQTNVVVNTAGAWAAQVAQMAGVQIPVVPVKRQVFVIETAVTPPKALPLTVFPSGLYLIHEHAGVFMCSKSLDSDPVTVEDFSWSRQHFQDFIWPELVEYVPAFDRLKVTGGWAGLYAVNTFDGNAILGEWPTLKGFFLANGFSGHGFQQCHAVGRYLAELILGQTLTLDLAIFSPGRILENKPVFESAHKLV